MPSFYHGSVGRYARDVILRLGKDVRNGWRKLVAPGASDKADKRKLEEELGQLARDGDRAALREQIGLRLPAARAASDPREMHYLASALERLEDYEPAYALRSESHDRIAACTGRLWDGSAVPDGKLAITPMRYDTQSLSYPIQYAAMIAKAGALAPGCRVYLPERLVPLFARSYPSIDARPDTELGEGQPLPEAYQVAPLDQVPKLFARSDAAIRAAFDPLLADPDQAAQLRARYASGGKPIVGIAWGSTNSRKDVPGFADWAQLLKTVPATFVSLQYGDVDQALRRLEQAAGTKVVVDAQIDQMTDMDGFAAQLAAMDVVVSISGTGAHLAGVMGRPMEVLLDDRFHLTWPYFSAQTPWYPAARLHRRKGRAWPDVMADVAQRVRQRLAT